jgi:hypothetical protein
MRNERTEQWTALPKWLVPFSALVFHARWAHSRVWWACSAAYRGTLLFQTSCKPISRHRTFMV